MAPRLLVDGAILQQEAYIMLKEAFGECFGQLSRVRNPPTLVSCAMGAQVSTVTEIQNEDAPFGLFQPITREDAYLVILQMAQLRSFDVLVAGRSVGHESMEAGAVRIVYLADEIVVRASGPLHLLIFYIPRRLLKDMADRHGNTGFDVLQCPWGQSFSDPIIHGLGQCLLPALRNFSRLQQPFVDYILMSLRSHLIGRFSGAAVPASVSIRGLTTWQERRAKDLMASHVQEGVSVAHLAQACHISPSGLVRGFKRNTGLTPYQWFLSLRINLAMDLMEDDARSLADVALQSGFADQSHFSRVFKEKVGISPGAWRSRSARLFAAETTDTPSDREDQAAPLST
ncbi:helix-turn-helix domain-containing protein [Dyella psychrodurans]|uniref:AraC family transcriptional regulator n=1 Tax=Dyella psychrodurans TaxID=1927960 RepID=A0A370X7A9_9GAMM|nr:AraC family transcriptional regulator [Dyella psychrodurans]RDS84246.1 AraC family transcriptional regulator [Dyella psychrodurans]